MQKAPWTEKQKLWTKVKTTDMKEVKRKKCLIERKANVQMNENPAVKNVKRFLWKIKEKKFAEYSWGGWGLKLRAE